MESKEIKASGAGAKAAPAKKKLTKKQINQIHAWVRVFVQLMFFIFLPSAYSSAFAGIKYMFTRLGAGEVIEVTAFVKVLLLLLIYTVVFGRFFCGFACAFGSLGDWVYTGIYPARVPGMCSRCCTHLISVSGNTRLASCSSSSLWSGWRSRSGFSANFSARWGRYSR